jgi:hypothetical protein
MRREGSTMQQGQVFELEKGGVVGSAVWAYRYGTGGPGSRRSSAGRLLLRA